MPTIQFKLSSKEDKNTHRREILIRFFNGKDFNVQTGSGIYVSAKHFEYVINRQACEKAGKNIPAKMSTCTADEAVRKGLSIYGRGMVVIRERILNEEGKHDKISKERLDQLSKLIEASFQRDGKAAVTPDWLKGIIDRFNHPENYLSEAEKVARMSIFAIAEQFLKESSISLGTEKHYRILFREMARYERFIQLTGNKRFTLTVEGLTRDRIDDFFDYVRNEHSLYVEKPSVVS